MKTTDIVTKHYRSAVACAANLTKQITSVEIWESRWIISSDRYFVVNPSQTGHLLGLVKTVRRQVS